MALVVQGSQKRIKNLTQSVSRHGLCLLGEDTTNQRITDHGGWMCERGDETTEKYKDLVRDCRENIRAAKWQDEQTMPYRYC